MRKLLPRLLALLLAGCATTGRVPKDTAERAQAAQARYRQVQATQRPDSAEHS